MALPLNEIALRRRVDGSSQDAVVEVPDDIGCEGLPCISHGGNRAKDWRESDVALVFTREHIILVTKTSCVRMSGAL